MGPFDRFNDRAKRVLALAQDEAIRFNHNYVGVEHLPLGLIREGEGVAARVLNSLGVDLAKARTSVEFINRAWGLDDHAERDNTLAAHQEGDRARDRRSTEARSQPRRSVRSICFSESYARVGASAQACSSLSGSASKRCVTRSSPFWVRWVRIRPPRRRPGSVPGRVMRSLRPHIGLPMPIASTEAAGERSPARTGIRRVLTQVGVDSADLVARIDAAAPPRPGPRPPGNTESRALLEVIARSASLAAERNSALIRSEHLLLLAIAAGDGVGATVLTAVGATPQRIREILDRMNG
jgi:ATP-dependent Clp protease ATP-binding subunit ClpA